MEYRLRVNLQIKEKNILNFTTNACNGTSPLSKMHIMNVQNKKTDF